MPSAQVNAIQLKPYNLNAIERFVGGDLAIRNGKIVIATKDGPLLADADDWIVKIDEDEFVAMKPKEFEATYQLPVTINFSSPS